MSFNSIIGNNNVKTYLQNICKSNKIAHSYIFSGIDGIGKSLIAKEFAKKILCLSNDVKCDNCKSCIEFESENHPDYIEIEPDGKNIKIDQIRELIKKAYEKPIISLKKVYIINDADLMTKEAQNCLLKTLEEPPNYVTIILVVSNENKLLNTIKSRCLKIVFSRLNECELKNYLQNNGINDIEENIILRANGSIKKLNHIYKNKETYIEIENIISNINKMSIIDVLKKLEIFTKNKEIINEILDYINVIFFEKIGNSGNVLENIKNCNCIKFVEETKLRIMQNANFDMCIDYLFFKIWEEKFEK